LGLVCEEVKDSANVTGRDAETSACTLQTVYGKRNGSSEMLRICVLVIGYWILRVDCYVRLDM